MVAIESVVCGLFVGLSVLAIDELVLAEPDPEKNIKQKIKTDPWAKFDLAWNLVDHDKSNKQQTNRHPNPNRGDSACCCC